MLYPAHLYKMIHKKLSDEVGCGELSIKQMEVLLNKEGFKISSSWLYFSKNERGIGVSKEVAIIVAKFLGIDIAEIALYSNKITVEESRSIIKTSKIIDFSNKFLSENELMLVFLGAKRSPRCIGMVKWG